MQLSHEARAPLASPWRDLPFLGRRAGRGSTLPLERLLALRPDLIIDAGTVDASCRSTARRVFEQTRIPDALIDGRLPESPHQLREAGRLLGVGPRGERLAECAESALVVCAGVRWLFARLHGIAERADWVEHAQEFDRLLYGFASVVTASSDCG